MRRFIFPRLLSSVFKLQEPVAISAAPIPECLRILVVDDSTAVLQITASLLRRKGHNVVTAMNGHDALAKLISTHGTAEAFELVGCIS